MGFVVEDKGEASVPDLFELVVHQPLLAAGVEPLGHIRVAVRVFWWGLHLNVGHTSPTLQLVVGIAVKK